MTKTVEQATLLEHGVTEERYAEARVQSEAREMRTMQRDEYSALLETRFREALAVPSALRDELRQCEEQTEAAIAEEGEAKQTAALLQLELENLHQIVPL